MKFAEAAFRDCGWCHTVSVAMTIKWSDRYVLDASQQRHYWAGYACPKCGGMTFVEFTMHSDVNSGNSTIALASEVSERAVLPRADEVGTTVQHLPDDIKKFFGDAQRALVAGLPDAAAVQLRKTLEAAAAKKGFQERNLVDSIRKLVEGGFVTLDFKEVLTHIRKIGNAGAHFTDVQLSAAEVERSLRFTTQVLRNLFEVPGELAELEAEANADESVQTG